MLQFFGERSHYRNTFFKIYTQKGHLQVESVQSCELYMHEHICEDRFLAMGQRPIYQGKDA